MVSLKSSLPVLHKKHTPTYFTLLIHGRDTPFMLSEWVSYQRDYYH